MIEAVLRQPTRAEITTRLPGAITDTVKRPALTLITTARPALTDTIRLPGQISIVTVMRGDPLVNTGGDAAQIVRSIAPASRSLAASQFIAAEIGRTVTPPSRAANAGQFLSAQIGRTIAAPTRSLDGYQPITAAITRTVSPATRALVASNTSSAFVIRNLNPATREAIAGQYLTASVSRTIASPTRAATASQHIDGVISRTLASATRSINGAQYIAGAASRITASPSRSLSAGQYLTAAITRTTPSATRAALGGQFIAANITRSVPSATRSLTGTLTLTGSIGRTLSTAMRSLVATQTITGAVTRAVPAPTRALAATQTLAGVISRTLPAPTRALSASQAATLTGAITRTLSPATRTATATQTATGAISRTVASATRALTGSSESASPPSFVALTPFVSGTGAVSPNFTATGRAAGDLLVIEIESANQTINTMPAGWHPLPSSPQGVGTAGAAGAVRMTLFGRKSTGGETTVAVPDSGDHTTAIGHVFRGVDMSMTGNLLANSNDLNNTTYWTKYMTTVTRTGTAPDGNQANRVVMTAGDPSDYFIAPITFNVVAGETYTYTGYCRATSGTQAFGIATFYSSTDEDTIIAASEAATTTIRRFSITFTADAADLSLYFCNPTSEAGFDIEFSNLQLFYGADAIDYEATTSAPVVNWLGVDVSAGTTQSATTSFSFPGVTTTKPNCLIAHFVANDRDAASTSNLSSITNANLTDLTKQFDQTVSTGQGGGLALITGVKDSAGTTGNTTATNAASNTNASITLALSPEP